MAIRLIPIGPEMPGLLAQGAEAFARAHGARLGGEEALVKDVVRQSLALLAAYPRERFWGGYLAVDEPQGLLVGTCAFKSAPSPEGEVEIAYFTFPRFEGRGIATAMASRLLELAFSQAPVRRVIAHTLPKPSASTRILEKLGLAKDGERWDPEDGQVWRWALSKEDWRRHG